MKRLSCLIPLLLVLFSCVEEETPNFFLTEMSIAPGYSFQLREGELRYSIIVPRTIDEIWFTGQVAGPFDHMEINDEPVYVQLFGNGKFRLNRSLKLDITRQNEIEISIFLGDRVRRYVFTVLMETSSVAFLSDIGLSAGALSPAFDKTVFQYEMEVGRENTILSLDPVLEDSFATATVYHDGIATDGNLHLNVGLNVIRIAVTSEDLTTQYNYSIDITRVPVLNTSIASLTTNQTHVDKTVNGDTYSFTFGQTITSLNLGVQLEDSLATYSITKEDGTPVNPSALSLKPGFNNYRITVTADDGFTQQLYRVEIMRNPWYPVKERAPFEPRDGALTTVFNDKLWLIDGWSWLSQYSTTNIWTSTSGWTWEKVGTVPWTNKHSVTPVVLNGKMWVLSDVNADVWSTTDGTNWTLVTANAPWGHRYSPYVFAHAGKLWLMGGISWWDEDGNYVYPQTGVVKTYNDVWSSTDGLNWTKVLDNAPWDGRAMSHGSPVMNGKMWIVGGGVKGYETVAAYNDVWSSSDGINWTKTGNAPWERRYHFSVAVHDNKLWISDGSVYPLQSNRSNEVWYSSDGANWKEIKGTPWMARHASSLRSFRGSLFLMCGSNRDGVVMNDIWKFDAINY